MEKSSLYTQALRDAEKPTGKGVPSTGSKRGGADSEDSEEEGEELLKNVKDRKQSMAKLNISPKEKELLQRLSEEGEGTEITKYKDNTLNKHDINIGTIIS